tara:strand:+ start:41 stop:601 length:561 start_codon:yes stop_codon:yes gene_type:complete
MNKIYISIAVALALGTSAPSFAQQCNSQIKPTASSDRLVDNGDGTVTDIQTSLMWSKCSLGQEVSSDGACVGTPTHMDDWSTALKAAQEAAGAEPFGYSDFRVPNIKELASIVEYSCIEPSISLEFFNGTPNAIYYSSTPDSAVNINSALIDGLYGRLIDFTDGTEFARDVNKNRYVRLVRDIKSN